MKRAYLFIGLFCIAAFAIGDARAADTKFLSCGPGYVMVNANKTDGMTTVECQKLWCRDLENGKTMGSNSNPNSGYRTTPNPIELCDADNNCIECFGDRRWCSGEPLGMWNPEYGIYTRGGGDVMTYIAYQKGNCFAWRLEKPDCPSDTKAILRQGEWVCATSTGSSTGSRESAVRRTGTIRSIIR